MPRMDGSSAIPGNFASKLGGALMMIRIDFAIVPAILVLIIGLCCLAFSKLEKQAAEFEAEKKTKGTPLTEDA